MVCSALWSLAMVPVSLARMALAAFSLRTSPICKDCITSCASAIVLLELLLLLLLLDDDDDDDDSYASLTNLDVDTRLSDAAAYICCRSFAAEPPADDGIPPTIFTGCGRVADACCIGDSLDMITGGDSGNVTSGSAFPPSV